ncbi:MAG: hypothetical protein IT309_08140 [Anaerolineales bacterium]|nr:hypothetical protein [Anaerolineales bacterium]
MLQNMPAQPITHSQIVSALAPIRQEWQEATEGISLLETDGNMGLVLADLINGFGLNVDDQCRILGNDLFHELSDFLRAPKQN